MTATASAASRTAGSAAPGPESIALRVALTSSIVRATSTLNRMRLDGMRALVNGLVCHLAQGQITRCGIYADLARHVTGQPPRARQELARSSGRDVCPVDVVLRRASEHHAQTNGVHAMDGQLVGQR